MTGDHTVDDLSRSVGAGRQGEPRRPGTLEDTPEDRLRRAPIGGRSRRIAQHAVTLSVDLAIVALAVSIGPAAWLTSAALAAAIIVGVHTVVPNPFATFGGHLGRRWGAIAAVVGLVSLAGAALAPEQAPAIAREAGAVLLGLGAGRTLLRVVALLLRRRGVWLERTIVVGAGPVAQQLTESLLRRRDFGLEPIGFVDDIVDAPGPLPLVGSPNDLRQALSEHGATTLLLAFGPVKDPELVHRVRTAVGSDPVRVLAIPRFFELGIARSAEHDSLWGYPLVELSPPPHHRPTWRMKRVVDIVAAATFLVLLAPLYGLIALAVKLSGPGPVIFRQERVSLQGEPIEVMKFRTMAPNSDSDVRWSVDDDDRVTRVGRILRPTHLDELPQLLNVLRGDMSLVGPRPERPHFVHQFNQEIHDYQHRHRVPAGLTGLAQVNGLWGDTSIRDRSRLDNRYIEDWSLLSDLRILGRTLGTLAGSRNDDAEGQPSSLAPSLVEDETGDDTATEGGRDDRPAQAWVD
jgi:exopolysaccharide biosynthesis polyprenyl glycosylphosphotransferase